MATTTMNDIFDDTGQNTNVDTNRPYSRLVMMAIHPDAGVMTYVQQPPDWPM